MKHINCFTVVALLIACIFLASCAPDTAAAPETTAGNTDSAASSADPTETTTVPVATDTESGNTETASPEVTGEGPYTPETTVPAPETTGPVPETTVPVPETTVSEPVTTAKEPETTEKPPVVTEPAHVHRYTTKVTAPTCTAKGYTVHTCSCGDTYTDSYVNALGHSYKNTVTAPTCLAGGYTTHVCSRCGDSYVDSRVSALGHSYTTNVVAPTCTVAGYTEHICTRCDDSYEDNTTAALGHVWGTGVVTTPATETAPGVMTYTCTRTGCGVKKTESIPQLAHTHSYTSQVVEPTCTAEGCTLYTCSCGDTYRENVVAALGHDWEEYGFLVGNTVECLCRGPMCNEYIVRPATEWDIPSIEANWEVLRERLIYHINQYRIADGVAPAEELTGKGRLLAKIRSDQLVNNFAHDIRDYRAATASLEYGLWKDGTAAGVQSYWDPALMEAIVKSSPLWEEGIDSLAYSLATVFYHSSGHWYYLGSAEYTYITAAATKSGATWYAAVLIGDTDQYE